MSDDTSTGGIERSPSSEFGHVRDGYAVEFNMEGFAFRSLTVEHRDVAEQIKRIIESRDDVTGAKVVRDS